MPKLALALTGVAAGGALALGTVGGAYACDLPGDTASTPVSSPNAAMVAARINQIEALVAKYDNDPKVSQEIADITNLVESYFTDPSAYQSKLTHFKDTAAYQKLQDKLAAIKAAAAAAQAAQSAPAATPSDTTPSDTTPTVPTPGSLPPAPHFWFHHHGWHHWGFGGDDGSWSGHAGFGYHGGGSGDDHGGPGFSGFGGFGG